MKIWILIMLWCYGAAVIAAETTSESDTAIENRPDVQQKGKTNAEPTINTSLVLGMNVRGNKESPLSLTIVPWRSAEHRTKNPEISASWRPELGLLQPEAYRRNINAFLKSR